MTLQCHPRARQKACRVRPDGSADALWRKSGDQSHRHSEATKLPKNLKSEILRFAQDDEMIPAYAGMTT